MSEVRANFAIKKDLVEQARAEAKKVVDLSNLEKKYDHIAAILREAYTQMGDSLDLGAVTVYGEGKTNAEVSEFIIKNHSELAGFQDELNERKRLKAERDEFLNSKPEDILNQNVADQHLDLNSTAGQDNPLNPAMMQLFAQQFGQANYSEPSQSLDLLNSAQAQGFLKRQQQLKNMSELSYEDMHKFRERIEAAYDQRQALNFDMPLRDSEIRNTLFQTSDGWAPQIIREAGWWSQGQRPIQLFDVIPKRPTNQSGVKFMLETTFSNMAAAVAEGGAIPESELEVTEQTVNIEKVGTILPVTLEQLEDVDEVQMYLNERLPFMTAQRADQYLYWGSGTAPQIRGIKNWTGVQAQALKIDNKVPSTPIQDLLDARTLIRVGAFTRTSHIGMHPNLWASVIKQNLSSDAIVFGNPQNNYQMRLFGIPIFEFDGVTWPTTASTQDVAVAGDFSMFSVIRIKRALNITMGYNADDFIKDKVTLKATIRMALVLYRPKAFCRITYTHPG